MTSKRERLQKQLDDAERRLADAEAAIDCNCKCHEDNNMLHFVACCSGYGENIPILQFLIADLKVKLRK